MYLANSFYSWDGSLTFESHYCDPLANASHRADEFQSGPSQPTYTETLDTIEESRYRCSSESQGSCCCGKLASVPSPIPVTSSRLPKTRVRSGYRRMPRLQLLARLYFANPTPEPTSTPTPSSTATPTPEPTSTPSEPTAIPTQEPTATPTLFPTTAPSEPTATPTPEPTANPTPEPTAISSQPPTPSPTVTPTAMLSQSPTPLNCPAGLYSPTGSWPCMFCAAGSYSARAGSTTCAFCPAGTLRCVCC